MRVRNAVAVLALVCCQKKRVVSSFPFFGLQGPEGDRTVAMALADPEKFVLKPQREGGGKVTSAYHQKKLAHDVSWYSLRCSLRCPFGGIPTGIIAKKITLHMTSHTVSVFFREQLFWR